MTQRVEIRREGNVVVIGVPAAARRLEELLRKPTRTQAENSELILLRLEQLEAKLDQILLVR